MQRLILAPLALGAPLLLAGVSQAAGTEAARPRFESSRLTWTHLTFRASKLGLSTTSVISIEPVVAGEVAAALMKPGQGEGVRLGGPDGLMLTTTTRLLGRDSENRLWLDPRSGAALQEVILETGKRNRYKASRFTRRGVFTWRRNPADKAQRHVPHAEWSDTSETYYPYSTAQEGVIDAGALFYVVSVADLRQAGDRIELPAFARRDAIPVEVEVIGPATLKKVGYDEASAAGTRTVEGPLDVLHLQVRALSSGEEDVELELLGLRGDVDLFLDPVTRIPLQVSGRVKVVGRVNVRLQQVVLR